MREKEILSEASTVVEETSSPVTKATWRSPVITELHIRNTENGTGQVDDGTFMPCMGSGAPCLGS